MKTPCEIREATHVVDRAGVEHRIASKWGIDDQGHLAKPSQGGFGCVTESGERISMYDANQYLREEPEIEFEMEFKIRGQEGMEEFARLLKLMSSNGYRGTVIKLARSLIDAAAERGFEVRDEHIRALAELERQEGEPSGPP